jgi:hypothetical protein
MKDWPDPRFDRKPVSRIEIGFIATLTVLPTIVLLWSWLW